MAPNDNASVTGDDVRYIRSVFKLSQRELANALGVAPYSVTRWEGGASPTGLPAEILSALHRTAIDAEQKEDDFETKLVRGLILMGIGALLFHLLSRR